MNKLFFLLVVMASFLSLGMAHAEDREAMPEEINLSEPPFWTMTYGEYKPLRQFQKDYYAKNLLPALKKLPGFEDFSESKIEAALEWHQSWTILARKVYVICRDKSLEKECDKVAEVREQAQDIGALRRTESLAEKSDSKSEKKTK